MKPEAEVIREAVSPSKGTTTHPLSTKPAPAYTANAQPRSVVEVRIDPEKRPSFANITDDYQLLENLHRYAKFCENFNVPVPQMANSLARAIGIQNGGRYSVIVYNYLLAIPEYPPTLNGRKEILIGEGRFCNMVCYKTQLFGVVMFPSSEHVTFYFPEFQAYTQYVQQLIFSYGNKVLRLCPEKRALTFDFSPEPKIMEVAQQQQQNILLTATLQQRKLVQEAVLSSSSGQTATSPQGDSPGDSYQQQNNADRGECIQLE